MVQNGKNDPQMHMMFRQKVTDLFDHFFATHSMVPFQNYPPNAFFTPPFLVFVDIIDRGKDFLVRANLPGADPQDVDVRITDTTVTIKGTFTHHEESQGEHYLTRERRYGDFQRSIHLAAPVFPDKSKAVFKNGVLEITLPKVDATSPVKLDIKEE